MDAKHTHFRAILGADDCKLFQANMAKMRSSGRGKKDMTGMQGMNHDTRDRKGVKMDRAATKP